RIALGFFESLCFPKRDAMGLKKPHFVAWLLGCVLAAPVFAQQPTIRLVRNPDPAPDFKLDTLEGKPVSLAEYKSKVTLLNFWATWCGPCRAEIPDLVELQNKYRDQLQIIGLVVDDDDPQAIKKFVEQFGINYPVAIATDELRMEYGGIPALPTSFLLEAQGREQEWSRKRRDSAVLHAQFIGGNRDGIVDTSFLLDAQGRVVQKHEGLHDPVLYEVEIRSLLGLPIGNVKVETFDDTGQIFLKHADRAMQLPGVDLSKLTAEQRTVALHKFNAESCTCGCQYTLAQCRIWDRNCAVSKTVTGQIIDELLAPAQRSADPLSHEKPAPRATPPASAEPAPASSSPVKPPAPEKPSTPTASRS